MADGTIFTGTFVKGGPEGDGRMVTKDGVYYEGEVSQGKASGQGKLENEAKGYSY